MKKLGLLVVSLILASVISLTLLGCGAQPTPITPTTSTTPTTPITPTTPTTPVKPIKLKFAIWLAPIHKSVTEVYKPWSEAINKETGGRVVLDLYMSESLAKSADTYDAILSGVADLGAFNPGFSPGRFPLSSVAELPFMSPSTETGSKLLNAIYDKYPQFQQEYGAVKALNMRCNVQTVLHTAKKPVRTMDDLKGLKIRANSPEGVNMLKALGATPILMAMTELYTSLEKGVVDGAVYTVEAVQSFGLGPVTAYTTEVPLTTVQSTFGMNQATFNRLPNDVQTLITTGKLGRAWLTEKQNYGANLGQDEGYIILKARGDKWQQIYLTSDEYAKWVKTLTPLRDEWAEAREKEGKPGKAVLKDWVEMLAKETTK